jgi:hypothetical protein
MYRLTAYMNDGEKTVDECEDEDELRDAVETAAMPMDPMSVN